jgi:RNA polymerase sigma factor (TIGR02999 family)
MAEGVNPHPGEITRLLQLADQGNREAEEQLFPLVRDTLIAIARRRKSGVGGAGSPSTTELVDDAFIRLVGRNETVWSPGDRNKFFGYASRKIHGLLIEEARKRAAAKRGGEHHQVKGDLDAVPDPHDALRAQKILLDLEEALAAFEEFAREEAEVFRRRYFLNCTFEEVAAITDVPLTTVKRQYARATAYLRTRLRAYGDDA